MTRLHFRLRSAIDASEAAASLNRLERLAEHIAARTEMVLAEAHRLERVELYLETTQRRLDALAALPRIEALLNAQMTVVAGGVGGANQKLDLILQRNLVPFGDVMAIRTDAGYLLAPAEDPGLALALLETRGSLEPGTSAVLAALAPPGGTVIDVGANVGTLTLPAARRVGPKGRVLALEAAPRIAAILERTLHLNGLAQVELRAVAAGDEDGTLRFNLSAQTTHNSMLPLEDITETIDIPSRRLDTLVAPGERVDLVKIDVEGAELLVWRGMQRVVADNPEIALVLEFGPSHLSKAAQSVSGWFEELQSTGLTAWEIDEASGQVRPLRAAGLEDVYSINILLLRGSPTSRGLVVQ